MYVSLNSHLNTVIYTVHLECNLWHKGVQVHIELNCLFITVYHNSMII